MKGIVAYCHPHGIYGKYYIFTVVLDFTPPSENITIQVTRTRNGQPQVYSCHSCGHFGNVTVTEIIRPTEHSVKANLNFYRYDNVEPGDVITITFEDSKLVFRQITWVATNQKKVTIQSYCERSVDNPNVTKIPEPMYEIFLIDWDTRLQEQQAQGRPVTVEEELITSVMNNQKITIQELLLQPARQPQLQSGLRFIEGELKYLN